MRLAGNGPRFAVAAVATGAALLSAARSPDVGAVQRSSVVPSGPGIANVRVLGINDLHGHLEPASEGGRRVGGVAWLAAALDASARGHQTIRVSAGDAVGASPLLSAHFHDEPTIEALDAMDFDVAAVGNHDFDDGPDEMLRLARLARHRYIGANALSSADGRPLLRPYTVIERDGVRIGFIGVTTLGTPRWLLPEHARRLRFSDISDTVNRYAAELREQGVRAIVVLAHVGGVQTADGGASGEIVDETRQMSDDVDLVVAGHTHSNMNVRVGHKLVVQALSYGTAFDRVDLAIERASGEVVGAAAEVRRTWHDELAPDGRLAALVERHRARVAPLATQAVGRIARAPSSAELGTIVARAQREAGAADMAFVPADWIRGMLPAGQLTYEDLFTVQPFGDRLIRLELSGRAVRSIVMKHPEALLRASGVPETIDPDRTYSVVANQFLAEGGEGFAEFRTGRRRTDVGLDIDALRDYLVREHGRRDPLAP